MLPTTERKRDMFFSVRQVLSTIGAPGIAPGIAPGTAPCIAASIAGLTCRNHAMVQRDLTAQTAAQIRGRQNLKFNA